MGRPHGVERRTARAQPQPAAVHVATTSVSRRSSPLEEHLAAGVGVAEEAALSGGPVRLLRALLGTDETAMVRRSTRTDVLSTTEVAELLGIPRSTMYELARRGDLPARRVGRRWLFLRDHIGGGHRPARRSGRAAPAARRFTARALLRSAAPRTRRCPVSSLRRGRRRGGALEGLHLGLLTEQLHGRLTLFAHGR